MTRSGGFGRRRLLKGSSSNKEKVFDQEGLAMDPIDVKPLNSVPPTALVPYGTSEDEVLAAERSEQKGISLLENQNVESSNLEDNPVIMMIEMMGIDTELVVDPFELGGFLHSGNMIAMDQTLKNPMFSLRGNN